MLEPECQFKNVNFEVNTVVALEPGAIEDPYLMTERGLQRLSTLPLELFSI